MTQTKAQHRLEVRHWNPAHDETEWIVIEEDRPITGWPEYTARVPYAFLEQARLFAAAPDLLAELELVADGLQHITTPWAKERLGFVRAAIAKAKP